MPLNYKTKKIDIKEKLNDIKDINLRSINKRSTHTQQIPYT